MKPTLVTGADKHHLLARSEGWCAVFAELHVDRVRAVYAIRGGRFPGGAACCERCAVALGIVKAPATEGAAPTLLPGVS